MSDISGWICTADLLAIEALSPPGVANFFISLISLIKSPVSFFIKSMFINIDASDFLFFSSSSIADAALSLPLTISKVSLLTPEIVFNDIILARFISLILFNAI